MDEVVFICNPPDIFASLGLHYLFVNIYALGLSSLEESLVSYEYWRSLRKVGIEIISIFYTDNLDIGRFFGYFNHSQHLA